ncbi:hypothetical protein NA56DRAFT_656185 [Hyaloscypha hepaticicola]|uniref:Uncharacterized protein n=1 Tax=Hyaloscypha hepaticicola TaxID=2082293 RepID=A0A2J6QDW5_9HELO|nr:hypothetical protein NA56DRAFT_656185 [Hyaloscypha hepaticicola]
MKTFVTFSLILGASAFAVPRSSCSFELTASGGQSGTIGQLSDGQSRIGGGLSAATFTINNGGIIDSAGRGCILTPSVEQFQCDQGVGPTYGFSIDSNETLTYSGSSVFYACPASETEWNLYTTPVIGQLKCVEIALSASGCGAAASVAPSVTTTTVTVYSCGVASSASTQAIYTSPVAQSSISATTYLSAPASPSSPSTPSVSPASPSIASVATAPIIPTTSEQPSYSATIVPPSIETTSPGSYPHSYISPASESVVIPTPSTSIIITPPTSTYLPLPPYANTTLSKVSVPATSTQTSSTCAATILTGSSTSGNYQYPHLIIPVSSSTPSTAAGTSYFGTISSNTSTIFNFDIPTSYSGSTCNLIFLLPLQSQLETSSYTFSGSGGVEFEQLSSAATQSTTWDNAPGVEKDLGEFTLSEGSSTLIESFACPAGQTVAFEMSAVGDTYLYYFQDWNPSPLGLYITVC